MNTRLILREAEQKLREAGVPDPEYDAGWLLAEVMDGLNPMELRLGLCEDPDEDQMAAFRALMDRRLAREPLQYILHSAWFRGFNFHIRPGVLIPRPETELLEQWAERFLSRWIMDRLPEDPREEPPRPAVLDLCCGSGALGLSLGYYVRLQSLTLTDLSDDAIAQTLENRDMLEADWEVLQGDLFAPVAGRKFDLILSNPPYIPSADCGHLQAEVMREPRLALDGGADGLDFYRRIAEEAPTHLNPGGALMMELGMGQAEPVARLLKEHGAVSTEIRRDMAGIDRMIMAQYDEDPID